MCLGVPGRVVDFDRDRPQLAVVDVAGVPRRVDTSLLDDLRVGDWVVVHVGFALSTIDPADALAALTMLQLVDAPDSVDT
ncbi:MAG: HypC/HybG/HupF family hydrogenase formation chaperone [Acidothermaceae bacterium]